MPRKPYRSVRKVTTFRCIQCGAVKVRPGWYGPVPKFCSIRCKSRWHREKLRP